MFSARCGYMKYKNCLGLGIYENDISCNNELFNQMYFKEGPFIATVATGCEIIYSGKGICVKGTMSNVGKAIMKVEFREM